MNSTGEPAASDTPVDWWRVAVAAVLKGAFSLFDASLQFVGVALGGVVVGMALAVLFVAIHKAVQELHGLQLPEDSRTRMN